MLHDGYALWITFTIDSRVTKESLVLLNGGFYSGYKLNTFAAETEEEHTKLKYSK